MGVISENRIEWVLAQMGAGLIGAITVGVYPTSPTPEVAYVAGHADVDIMVCEDQEQTDKLLAALPQLPRLKKIIVMETKGLRSFAPGGPRPDRHLRRGRAPGRPGCPGRQPRPHRRGRWHARRWMTWG